jgi:hypothetical protein
LDLLIFAGLGKWLLGDAAIGGQIFFSLCVGGPVLWGILSLARILKVRSMTVEARDSPQEGLSRQQLSVAPPTIAYKLTGDNGLQFDRKMTGIQYENFCASALRRHGWTAMTTKSSGDQRLDIRANYAELNVAIQCKQYGQKVGNSAVQQVHAAKHFYKLNHAVVIAPSGFTRSAQDLAKQLGVALVSHSQLHDLRAILRDRASRAKALN